MDDTSTHFRGIYVSPTATLLHERTKWKCGHRYINGDPCCRVCDSVERLNQLAERLAECNEVSGLFFELAYICAADIVIEEFDE